MSSPILRVIFRPKSEIQTFFSPKFRWSPKKKKKTKIETDFSAEIGNSNVFFAQIQVVSKKKKKKKKRSSPKLRLIFRPKSEIQTFFSPKFRWSPKKKKKTKIETDFSAEIGNSNVFFAQIQVVSKKKKKKKKGLHQNWDWFFGRNRKFKRFFRPNSGGLQKKKKGLHQNWDWFFGGNSNVFFAQIQVVSKKKKKKKRSSPKLRLIFRPKSEIQTFFSPKFRWSP